MIRRKKQRPGLRFNINAGRKYLEPESLHNGDLIATFQRSARKKDGMYVYKVIVEDKTSQYSGKRTEYIKANNKQEVLDNIKIKFNSAISARRSERDRILLNEKINIIAKRFGFSGTMDWRQISLRDLERPNNVYVDFNLDEPINNARIHYSIPPGIQYNGFGPNILGDVNMREVEKLSQYMLNFYSRIKKVYSALKAANITMPK